VRVSGTGPLTFKTISLTSRFPLDGVVMQKLPNDDYKMLLHIVAEIDSTAEATGYHSCDPEPFSTKNTDAWQALNDFCKERFEGVA